MSSSAYSSFTGRDQSDIATRVEEPTGIGTAGIGTVTGTVSDTVQKLDGSFFRTSQVGYTCRPVEHRSIEHRSIEHRPIEIEQPLSKVISDALREPQTTPSADEQKRQTIVNALEQNLFFLYYQEVRPARESERTIREVLLRLPNDRTGQILRPRDFLPTAKRFDLMRDVDAWVIRHCFQEIAQKIKHDSTNTLYSINLSACSLNSDSFLSVIEQALSTFSINPNRICFEIEGRSMVSDLHKTIQTISRIKSLGFRFALDNFGKEASFLSYLRELSIDYLKVDGTLISEITNSQRTRATLALVNHFSHSLGIKTIATHVSSSAIAEASKRLNFDYTQGFIISEPRPFMLL